jgi:hypothetical protein
MTVSYSVSGGGSPPAPNFNYVSGGITQSLTLTTAPFDAQVDGGSSWYVTPNPLTGSSLRERWYCNQPLAGTASTTMIVFVFYHQYSQRLSYSVSSGLGYSAPEYSALSFGTPTVWTLPTMATRFWFDAGSAWSTTNPLSGSSSEERWFTSQLTSGTISGPETHAFTYQHQYFLRMRVSPSGHGITTPASGWYNAGSTVAIRAKVGRQTGYAFISWVGTGTGSYTGPANPTTVTMNSAITETADFT